MPPQVDDRVKGQVIQNWLAGNSRDEIAIRNGIGAGTVSNIISEFKCGLENYDYNSIRELSVQLKREGMTFPQLASIFRRRNYIKKLGVNEDQIELLIANLLEGARSLPQEKVIELLNQLFELSESESIPPTEVPVYVKQKIEEKKRLGEEIQKSRAILDQENIDVRDLNEYKKSKEELKKYGFSAEAPRKLVSVIQSFKEMGYDPQKIVTNYAHIKSLRQTVRAISKECRMWESRAARFKEIIPLCEQIDSFGIGFPELVVFRSAVIRIAEIDNLSYGEAAYVLMARIDTPGKIADMEKQLNETIMKIQMVSVVSARQNDAVIALAKLQCYGITENQILNLCKTIEVNGHSMTGAQPTNSNSYYAF